MASDAWTYALLNAGLGMLGSAGRNEPTASALAAGGQGALSGVQMARQAGQSERQQMLDMARLQADLQGAAQQRQQYAAELAAADKKNKMLGDYASGLQDPARRTEFMLDPSGYLQAQRDASAAPKPVVVGGSLVDPTTGQAIYTAPDKPKDPPNLVRELIAAGYQPGTPEFQEILTQIKTKPQTQINMGDKAATAGAVAQAQAEAKNTVERQMAVGDELLTVQEGRANAEKMLGLSGEAPSGPGAGFLSGVDKAIEAVTLGYGGAGVDSTAYDELNARMSKEVLNAASLLSGTISDKDMETLESVSGGGPLSEEARSNVIRILQDGYAKKERMLKAEQEALDSGASAVEAKRAATKTNQGNRIRYDAEGNRVP